MAPDQQMSQGPVVPFDVTRRTWPQLIDHVMYWRNWNTKFRNVSSSIVTNFNFSQRWVSDGIEYVQVYGLGAYGKQYTVCYVNVALTAPQSPIKCLTWTPVLSEDPQSGALSHEQELLRERMRSNVSGVTNYHLNQTNATMLMHAPPNLYWAYDSPQTENATYAEPVDTGTLVGNILDPIVCPTHATLIACVSAGDVHFICDGVHVQATFKDVGSDVTNGCTSFVMQEEFDRYSGMWWAPTSIDGKHMLMYERVDESQVSEVIVAGPGSPASPSNNMKYPRVGTPNAISTMHLLIVQVTQDHTGKCIELHVDDLSLIDSLSSLYPWTEYIVRAGWLPDSSAVWVQLLNRQQTQLAIVRVPVQCFAHCSDSMRDLSTCAMPWIMHEETSAVWIYPHNSCIMVGSDAGTGSVRFIWASECTGYRHLYLIETIEGRVVKRLALTSGQWSVLVKAQPVLDTQRKLVYFYALKDSPIENHIYVTSYCESMSREIVCLTPLGDSDGCSRSDSNLYINPAAGLLITWRASLARPPTCILYTLNFNNQSHLPKATELAELLMNPSNGSVEKAPLWSGDKAPLYSQILSECEVHVPQLVTYPSKNSGVDHYALLFLPFNWNPQHTYPIIVQVYAGPEIQLVQNVWMAWRGLQKFTTVGYAVIMIDGRGSANRGLDFEAHIKTNMGGVEVEDQVEGLQAVVAQSPCPLDMSRVAMFGWSYGGYTSLLALIKRPDIFKMAIAGGPVTSWYLYDTGYTERYMGLPLHNCAAYNKGDVVLKAHHFPDEPGRLMLVHGLIDENVHFEHTAKLITALQRASKPYHLQVFPRERHGIRSTEANNHLDASILLFMQQHL